MTVAVDRDAADDHGSESRDLWLDHDREARTGIAEAVYAPGKSAAQCAAAVRGLLRGHGTGPVMLTRADSRQATAASRANPGGTTTEIGHDRLTGETLSIVAWRRAASRCGAVTILAAGTADLPTAREVSTVLTAYGYVPDLLADAGVAGIHRVLSLQAELASADVLVVLAGMEGALASVAAGLTSAPVIAVPTSTGYGAGLEGVTALLAMHASCSPGITVVGIDNGFGAACAAVRMLRMWRRREE